MENVQKFDFEGIDVRTTIFNGEPLFVANDVAYVLGYVNLQKAVRDHVDNEDKGVHEMVTPGIGLTPRVTGKGQRYFVDKYCPRNMELEAIYDGDY